jgi:hypothetical protein
VPGRSSEPEVIHLSKMSVDPVSSMRAWGAEVTFADRTFKVPAVDAAGWLELLLAEDVDYEAIFPGLAGPEVVFTVNQMMVEGDATEDDLRGAILDLIEAVSGRSWWITLRLCYSIRSNWESIGGEMARRGVYPWGMPLGYWLDAAYSTVIELMVNGPKPKTAADWSRAIVTPPPSENRSIDEEANAMAFMAALRAAQ